MRMFQPYEPRALRDSTGWQYKSADTFTEGNVAVYALATDHQSSASSPAVTHLEKAYTNSSKSTLPL